MRQDMMTGLAEVLRSADPSNPQQVAEAEALVGGVMAIAMAFMQERVGKDAASLFVEDMFEKTAARVLGDGKPVSVPVGTSVPTLEPAPRKADPASIQGRAETMFEYLRARAPAEAEVEARASIWASAALLRERCGEAEAHNYLRFMQAKMSLLGWFEHLPVPSLTRH